MTWEELSRCAILWRLRAGAKKMDGIRQVSEKAYGPTTEESHFRNVFEKLGRANQLAMV